MRFSRALALAAAAAALGGCRAPSADPAAARTLVVWEQEDAQVAPFMDSVFAKFRALPGNQDVKIVRTHYHGEDLRQQFQTASIAGSPPDLVIGPNDAAGIFSISGFIQSVDDLFDLSKYDERARDAIKLDGRRWGVPVSIGNHLLFYYNKRLTPRAPETTQALFAECRRLKAERGLQQCLALNLAEPYWLVPWLGAYGGWPLEGRVPTLNTPAMRKALDFHLDLVFNRKLAPGECDYNCMDTLFKEGKAAFIVNGDWAISTYYGKFGADLGLARIPRLSETGRWPTPMMNGMYFMLSSQLAGEKLALARRLVEFYTNEPNQIAQTQTLKRLPGLASAAKSKALAKDPLLAASLSQLLVARPMPIAVEMRAVWDAIRPNLGSALVRKIPTAEAAVRMQLEAEEKIKEMNE